MRLIQPQQRTLGETPIECIRFDLQSRDDIPQILRGLQHIYSEPVLRDTVFGHLWNLVPADVDADNGRPGMMLWNAFVLATLRTNLNCDYDRIVELANEHRTLRMMLGHEGPYSKDVRYCRQTVEDNLHLFTEEILDEINQAVVKAGHRLFEKEDEPLAGRCDSFVVETDVEYPTDIRLLQDAVRKAITICGKSSAEFDGISGWRQYEYNCECIRNLYLKAQRIKHSNSPDEKKKEAQNQKVIKAHEAFIERAEFYLDRALNTLNILSGIPGAEGLYNELRYYIFWGYHQIGLIRRRVIQGETIPHSDKIFSLFEPHTEWVSKGKAGVPVELGLRVCILEDELGFILHHQVMEQETDDKVAVSMVRETRERFPNLRLCSFDKGFWSLDNRKELEELLDKAVLPKKGGLSKTDREIQTDPEFIAARKQHAAVESAINALEVHGLDVCPDHGVDGFKRYVALAVVSRNIQKIGATLLQRERRAGQIKARRMRLAA